MQKQKRKFKFILNDQIRTVHADNRFFAVMNILKAFPEHGATKISKLNLLEVK